MKRTKIKPVSSKRAKELRLYAKLRVKFLSENPMCQVCGGVGANSVHHRRGRGVYLNEVKYFLGTCFNCHNKIENNRKWAFERGYLLDRIGHD